jgi:hypothetical protein
MAEIAGNEHNLIFELCTLPKPNTIFKLFEKKMTSIKDD